MTNNSNKQRFAPLESQKVDSARRRFLTHTGLAMTAASLAVRVPPVIAQSPARPASSSRLAPNPLGFTGQRLDPVTRLYHLGNGHRIYNPSIMRFHAADSMSPFGKGGVNSYAYTMGDPINLKDPSGHFAILSLIIGAIVGAIAGAAVSAVAEGISSAVQGRTFDWKQVAIGAGIGFISGGFGAVAQGGKTLAQVGLAVADSVVSGAADFGLNVATGASIEDAGKSAGVGALIGLATFGLGKGIGRGVSKSRGSSTSYALSQLPQEVQMASLDTPRFSALTNHKQRLFDNELLQYRQTSQTHAHINRIGGAADLTHQLSQPGRHKFVLGRNDRLNIGTINGVNPKSLSHPVLARGIGEDVISAGYIGRDRLGNIYVTNHSGHYRPSYESLSPMKETLGRMGVRVRKVRAGERRPWFLFLHATKIL